MDDSSIVDLFLQRDQAALKETQAKYGVALTGLCRNGCASQADGDECVNDTYLALWNAIPPHEPRDYFFPFCAAVARKRVLDKIRQRDASERKGELVSLSDELACCLPANDTRWDEVDSRLVLKELLNRFLGTLSKDARVIFMRRYWFFEPVSDIARALSVSESKVKTSLFRSREKLRKLLEEEAEKERTTK